MCDQIRGERITLRQPRVRDAPLMATLADDPRIAAYTTLPSPYRLEHALAFISSLDGKGDEESYAVEAAGEFVGMMSLVKIERGAGRAEVGYWLGAPYRGRGFAGEALDLLLGRAFEGLGLERVWARVIWDNAASSRLLASRGFSFERYAEEAVREGAFQKTAHYGLSRDAWQEKWKVGQRT